MRKLFGVAIAALLHCSSAYAQLEARDFDANGTVDGFYDVAQNITWLADGNLRVSMGYPNGVGVWYPNELAPGEMIFTDALAWVPTLNVAGVSGWRLPDRFNSMTGPRGPCGITGDTGCYPGYDWGSELGNLATTLAGTSGSFVNLSQGQYLSGYAPGSLFFEMRSLYTGSTYVTDSASWAYGYVLPVHDGDVGAAVAVTPVPEPETYALMLSALAALGVVHRRRAKLRPHLA